MIDAQRIISVLARLKLPLTSEKELQADIEMYLPQAEREYVLDKKNVVDFFLDDVAIEVKIKGSAKQIYKQCERYCAFDQVKALILVTNRAMGFPEEMHGKPCYVINIGKAWL